MKMDLEHKAERNFIFWIQILLAASSLLIGRCQGLEGIPSWMCLGMKSPFVEFKSEVEILSNISLTTNLSMIQSHMLERESNAAGTGLKEFNSFYQSSGGGPMGRRNQSTDRFFEMENMYNVQYKTDIKQYTPFGAGKTSTTTARATTAPAIVNIALTTRARFEPEVRIIEPQAHERFIKPLALKNTNQNEPKKSTIFQDSSTNFDDFKRHLAMLHNRTKHDKNFQSTFVNFPGLKKEEKIETTTEIVTTTSEATTEEITSTMPTTTAKTTSVTRQSMESFDNFDIPASERSTHILSRQTVGWTKPELPVDNDFFNKLEKMTAVPQVFLQNDQTPIVPTTTTDSELETTTPKKSLIDLRRKKQQQRRKNGKKDSRNNNNRLCKEVGNKLVGNCSFAWDATGKPDQITVLDNVPPRRLRKKNQQQRRRQQQGMGKQGDKKTSQPLQRSARSSSNANFNTFSRSGPPSSSISMLSRMNFHQGGENFFLNETSTNNNNVDTVNLNPNLCYQVGGLSNGQRKLCVLHTSIMPAISRGARSAIQECKRQFKNRRYNCETVNDDSVFGPITSLGSPEMAFIHALASAGVTSFIARACRDGQLASCGCSRGARPKDLKKDWTWGGCGDDLEFGYKFSQNFIDVREKEKKRGTRGLITMPRKSNNQKQMMGDGAVADDANNNATETESEKSPTTTTMPQHMLELQEKIKKEILSSKLEEDEMKALQEKITREILNSKIFKQDHQENQLFAPTKKTQKREREYPKQYGKLRSSGSLKARSLMNIHNNEVGRRAVLKKSRVVCKCHGVSGSCSVITCWQQLTTIKEVGDYLREKYDEATRVKINKRGRLQVFDPRYKVPSAMDLIYLDESPDWCRNNKQLKWPGTHGRVCNKTSTGLDSCSILCCGRGYNTKKIEVRERCKCKFHWCCQVNCEICTKTIEEYTCK